MPKGYRDYEESLKESLRDPKEAAEYLNACLEAGSPETFLLALRQVASAQGMTQVARTAELGRESLYRALSGKGNPRLATLLRVLDTAGLRLAVQTKKRPRRAA
jgi:probable addiction module antidote protein